ncbi:MAG: carboxymuconolactone decarboxylase family protein [Limnobacter sp.]|nr:carboxymuconolactone decarboxylase family protein [Limnobacter sp.]
MSTIATRSEPETDPRVRAVFDDIRATRKSDFVNNFWRSLAFDPDLLERTWAEAKAVMSAPSALDPLTKELLYIAVSATNGCAYCVHSHTAAARAKGMSDAQHADLLRVIALAAKTNQLATALQVPVDAAFDADRFDG